MSFCILLSLSSTYLFIIFIYSMLFFVSLFSIPLFIKNNIHFLVFYFRRLHCFGYTSFFSTLRLFFALSFSRYFSFLSFSWSTSHSPMILSLFRWISSRRTNRTQSIHPLPLAPLPQTSTPTSTLDPGPPTMLLLLLHLSSFLFLFLSYYHKFLTLLNFRQYIK